MQILQDRSAGNTTPYLPGVPGNNKVGKIAYKSIFGNIDMHTMRNIANHIIKVSEAP